MENKKFALFSILAIFSVVIISGCVQDATGINSFEDCVNAGNPVMEIYPRQCRTADGRTFTEEDICVTSTGVSMSLFEAKGVAQASDCMLNGTLKDTGVCNSGTGTWWIDMDIEKAGCNPACVVDIEARTAEINWRCTGLIQ